MRTILTAAIIMYQRYISPLFPGQCRVYTSCSTYARQAYGQYGIFKATYLTGMRILKCHPYHPGGYDPLP
jgi:putative membrane protein insertion efficiency factor